MSRIVATVLLCASVAFAGPALAAKREPCSGKKGGIDRCEGGKYVCKDGSKSTSKKICER